MIFAGIDPGSRHLGFGFIEAHGLNWRHLKSGVINMTKHKSLHLRLSLLYRELNELFLTYKPNVLAIEKVFLGKSVDSAFTLGHARGVCLAVAGMYECPFEEYSPKTVKKGIAGFGGADKVQMEKMICAALGLPSVERHDAADALALALYGGRQFLSKTRVLENQGFSAIKRPEPNSQI